MKRLHFVDIDGCKILSFDPATNACEEVFLALPRVLLLRVHPLCGLAWGP